MASCIHPEREREIAFRGVHLPKALPEECPDRPHDDQPVQVVCRNGLPVEGVKIPADSLKAHTRHQEQQIRH